jgi:hypothetical protein
MWRFRRLTLAIGRVGQCTLTWGQARPDFAAIPFNVFATRSGHNLFPSQLLILDGHTSHVSLSFIEYCEQQYIIPLCLPPHSTHILRPLDVGSSLHLLRLIRHVVMSGHTGPTRAKRTYPLQLREEFSLFSSVQSLYVAELQS